MSGGVILVLSGLVAIWGLLPGELALRAYLLACATPAVTSFAASVGDGGTWRLLVPGTLVLLAVSQPARRHWWLWTGILALAPAIDDGWKHLVGRPRPDGVALGFPSGHAAAAAAFALLVVYFVGRSNLPRGVQRVIRLVAGIGMVLVGLARILLDAHWPADVVVGFAFGVACASAGVWWHVARSADAGAPGRLAAQRDADESGSIAQKMAHRV